MLLLFRLAGGGIAAGRQREVKCALFQANVAAPLKLFLLFRVWCRRSPDGHGYRRPYRRRGRTAGNETVRRPLSRRKETVIQSVVVARRPTPCRPGAGRGPSSRGKDRWSSRERLRSLRSSRATRGIGPGFRSCRKIAFFVGTSFVSSFPHKQEPRDFSHLPLAPRFRGGDNRRGLPI